jgi:hypothetical protein
MGGMADTIQLAPIRCLECHGLEPDLSECVECMGTGRDLSDVEWERLHDEFLSGLTL